MNGTAAIVAAYRGLQRLYPRTSRDAYGADMVLLLRQQLEDEPTWRVCGRTVLDLLITVPVRDVEVHMTRARTPALVLVVSFAIASVAFALVEGLLGIVVAALGAALACSSGATSVQPLGNVPWPGAGGSSSGLAPPSLRR